MFGSYSERTLLSLGPDVTVIFVIKNATLGSSGYRSKIVKTQEKRLKRNYFYCLVCTYCAACYD